MGGVGCVDEAYGAGGVQGVSPARTPGESAGRPAPSSAALPPEAPSVSAAMAGNA
jgi:hypothetical protein